MIPFARFRPIAPECATHRRPAVRLLLLVLLVVLASCAGDEHAGTIGPAGGTVTSEDGALTLEIPAGALQDEMSIALRVLTEDEWPEELALLDVVGDVYELSPSGLSFAEPVTVTRRLDAAALGVDLGDRVPLVLLANSRADGTWSLLDGASVRADGGEIVAEARMSHFSRHVVLWNERITFRLDRPAGVHYVGETFTVTGQIELIEAPPGTPRRMVGGVDLRELWAYTGRWEWARLPPHDDHAEHVLHPDNPRIIELSAGPVLRPRGATAERLRDLGSDITPEFDPAEIGTILLLPPASWEFQVSYTCIARGTGNLGIGAAFGHPEERALDGQDADPRDRLLAEMFPDWWRPAGYIREMEVVQASVDCIAEATDVEHPLKVDIMHLLPDLFPDESVAEPQETLHPPEVLDALGVTPAARPDDADDEQRAEDPAPGFEVGPIHAVFDPPRQSTTYRAAFTNSDESGVQFEWSGPDCGEWAIIDGRSGIDFYIYSERESLAGASGEMAFIWWHPHPPCDPTTDHAHVTIQLTVRGSDGSVVVCTYGGAHSGSGPACEGP